ncbi:alpha/beta fold hydrolase [Virgibacillus halophilus]|uniref:Alpha/beta fold hydrolase n=1 Tax=Tigheibacillus halophilus TaxID=361280 RepID=A0ABU5C7P8_9BACI|nr:alpha/beta fold hydrolase [Virgibacillus halophilus]
MKQDVWLRMTDGHEVFVNHWYDEKNQPKAVLQIAHGMAEHSQRYEGFAEFLVNKGVYVVANDHRGHGRTGENSGALGFFAEEYGFEKVVDDLKEVNLFIHEVYPGVPVFMMGHSMGSFLVRRFIQCYHGDISGVVISGTGGSLGLLGKVGKLIAKTQIWTRGKRTESPLMNKLSFGNYNQAIPDVQTDFDWLTKDQDEVKKYMEDPYCGFISTSGFFYDLLSGIEALHQADAMQKNRKRLAFFCLSVEIVTL